MINSRVVATYRIETAAPAGAGGRGDGRRAVDRTFVRVPGETDELRERFGATGRTDRELEAAEHAEPAGRRAARGPASRPRTAGPRWSLSFPLENMGPVAARTCWRPSRATCSSCASSRACGSSTSSSRRPSPRPIPARSSASRGPAGWPGSRAGRSSARSSSRASASSPEETAALVADARRGRHRLHQGRRADGQPAPLAARASGSRR